MKKKNKKLLGHWPSRVKLTLHDELDLWIQINWEWHHLQSGTSGPTQSPHILAVQSVSEKNEKLSHFLERVKKLKLYMLELVLCYIKP
jgi:hypothetical protein